MKFYHITLVLTIFALLAAGCEPSSSTEAMPEEAARSENIEEEPTEEESKEPEAEQAGFTGELNRQDILEGDANWERAFGAATADEEDLAALGEVEPGAEIKVVLGVWCPDSVREVTRFWNALDHLEDIPFEVEYVGLDRGMDAGDLSLENLNIIAVPTFIVYRDGEEVGRVVERSPNSIESDLHSLLSGDATGMISATR